MNKKESTFFIAKCGEKYLYEWREAQLTSYVWLDAPTKFDTKEECLKAVDSTLGKPDFTVVIKKMKETVITEIVSEECCSGYR